MDGWDEAEADIARQRGIDADVDRAVEEMGNLPEGDPEAAHSEAETILCKLLMELGAGRAVDAFEEARKRIGFWYS